MPNVITDEQIRDVYIKVKEYCKHNDYEKNVQKHIVDKIRKNILNEDKFQWNKASLTDYINDIIYLLKGKQFARTINSYAEKYFIENICNDFNETICENAKYALEQHKIYYKKIISKKPIQKDLEKPMLGDNRNKRIRKSKIKNIILYGVPGVGKTYNHKNLIDMIESNNYSDSEIFNTFEKHNEIDKYEKAKSENRVEFITFHQSFGYEDFIEGFRPNEDGDIKLEKGIFRKLCKEAEEDKDKNFYLAIDEINRGNISKIFGELITLIEEDKRDTLHVTLPYSKEEFSIPSNVYIIGTMNSTDKSIALIDIALRRRFTFIKMEPNIELVSDTAKKLFENLNDFIEKSLGKEYLIGHSYFMNIEDKEDLAFACKYKIQPLLEEYFYGDEESLDEVLNINNRYLLDEK